MECDIIGIILKSGPAEIPSSPTGVLWSISRWILNLIKLPNVPKIYQSLISFVIERYIVSSSEPYDEMEKNSLFLCSLREHLRRVLVNLVKLPLDVRAKILHRLVDLNLLGDAWGLVL